MQYLTGLLHIPCLWNGLPSPFPKTLTLNWKLAASLSEGADLICLQCRLHETKECILQSVVGVANSNHKRLQKWFYFQFSRMSCSFGVPLWVSIAPARFPRLHCGFIDGLKVTAGSLVQVRYCVLDELRSFVFKTKGTIKNLERFRIYFPCWRNLL